MSTGNRGVIPVYSTIPAGWSENPCTYAITAVNSVIKGPIVKTGWETYTFPVDNYRQMFQTATVQHETSAMEYRGFDYIFFHGPAISNVNCMAVDIYTAYPTTLRLQFMEPGSYTDINLTIGWSRRAFDVSRYNISNVDWIQFRRISSEGSSDVVIENLTLFPSI